MLKFDDMDAVQDYLDLIEEYRDDHLNDDDSDMLLADVDPGVNELETLLGYQCLSSLYDSLEYLDDEFRDNARGVLDIYMGDPTMQLLLNRKHEVWVEDTIYKVVADYKYYKIVGADVDVLNSIRSDPDEPTVDTNTVIEYFNDNVPPITFRHVFCTAFLDFIVEPPATGLSPKVYVRLKMQDQDGVIKFCDYPIVKILWGDGSSSQDYNKTFSHTYSVAPNATVTFTIEASMDLADPNDCLGCDEGTYEASTTYTVTNNYCKKVVTNNVVLNKAQFSAGGHDWQVEGWGGQNPTFKFLNDPKVWGEICTWMKNGNGNYKPKRPNYHSYIRIYKSTFNHDDCSEGETTFDSYELKRDNKVRVVNKAHRNFSTQNELSEEPLLDFKVFITSGISPNYSSLSNELHPD